MSAREGMRARVSVRVRLAVAVQESGSGVTVRVRVRVRVTYKAFTRAAQDYSFTHVSQVRVRDRVRFGFR